MKARSGFTLVEVVMALGIFSFAIIALFGLMSVGLRSGKESASDLALGLMTQTASSVLHAQGFSEVTANSTYSESNSTPNFYFNNDGDIILDSSGRPSTLPGTNGIYACTVQRRAGGVMATTNSVMVRMVFSWPLSANETNRQKKTILTSLANHD